MPEYRERLKNRNGRSNAETVLKVKRIPCGNHLTRPLDDIDPGDFGEEYNRGVETAAKYRAPEDHPVVGKEYHLIALDGVWFYQSREVHCPRLKMKDGGTPYYYDMIAAALVKPGGETVLPLNPEFIRNEDGSEEQDCERKAASGGFKTTRNGIDSLILYSRGV
jgi:hypothetical protein